jgi:hypothetical protein
MFVRTISGEWCALVDKGYLTWRRPNFELPPLSKALVLRHVFLCFDRSYTCNLYKIFFFFSFLLFRIEESRTRRHEHAGCGVRV